MPKTSTKTSRTPRAKTSGRRARKKSPAPISTLDLESVAAARSDGEPDALFAPHVVWYRLRKLTDLINRPFFSSFAKHHDISINEWRILATLGWMGEAASHELCDTTGMHPMNVSRAVAQLRRRGHISERTDPANRRRKILAITPEGKVLFDKSLPGLRKVTDFLLSSMSPLEIEILSKLVDALISSLESVSADDLVAPEAE